MIDERRLPAGWSWMNADQIAANVPNALTIGPFGSSLKVADYTSSGVPLVFVRDIRKEVFGGSGTKFVSHEKAESLIAHLVRPGDLLVTKMGDPPGDTAVYPEGRPEAVITADCIKLTPDPRITSAKYLAFMLRSPGVRAALLEQTKGVAQQKLSLERFRLIPQPIAPLAEQVRIVAKLDALFARSLALRKTLERLLANQSHNQLSKLSTLEQSILAQAFRGELVPQDPNDEPASVLLERIRAEREASAPVKGKRGARAPARPRTPKATS